MNSPRATISYVWYHDPNLALTSHLLCRDVMDGKIPKSLMSLRTQQLLHDRCICQKEKKNRNTKAVKVAAVLKCQIGLKRATWIYIFEQHVLPQESALLLLYTKTGKEFPLKIKTLDYLHMCTKSVRCTPQPSHGKAGAETAELLVEHISASIALGYFIDLCPRNWNCGEEKHWHPKVANSS